MKFKHPEAQLHPTLCQYLGHFKQARYMREGHNTNAVLAPDGHRLDGTRVDHVPGQEWRVAADLAALGQGGPGGQGGGFGSPGTWESGVGPTSTIQPYSPSGQAGKIGTGFDSNSGAPTPVLNGPTSSVGLPKPQTFVSQVNNYRPRTLYI